MAKQQKYLVIHCTATPEGRNITSDDIRRMHLSKPPVGRGWSQVGYSKMFHLDGRVENLVQNNDDNIVDPWEITNGVAGVNSVCKHIVYVGGVSKDGKTPKDTRTPQQHISLKNYVKEQKLKHPTVQVVGHYYFAKKACPSFNVEQWLKSIGV